jgi:hypothetical protein
VDGIPVIFTPDNEPYLGLPGVFHFDQIIGALVKQQVTIASWTRTHTLSPLQEAASELVPGACSLFLSIRELVRQAYLYPAMVLLRPLVERVGTLTYLIENPQGLPAWRGGWQHGSRPGFSTLLRSLQGPDPASSGPDLGDIARRYHGLVHGGPDTAQASLVIFPEGAAGFVTGKDIHSPERANSVCFEAAMYGVVLLARCGELFPDVVGQGP